MSKSSSTSTAGFRLLGCLVSALALGVCGCEKKAIAAETAAAAAQMPPPEVGVIEIQPVSVPLSGELPGYVKPIRVAQVRARVAGILKKQVFREGTDVTEGDLLFEIDPELFEARVASAEASVAQADANIARSKANLTQAELLATRYRGLVESKAVSQQELDNAISAELQAKAELKGAEAGLLAARAALKAARLDLDYTKVTAPISGRIGRPLVTEGALVGQGEATPLAEINQMEPVYVDFVQPANQLTQFKRQVGVDTDWSKIKVSLLMDDGTVYEHPGKLLFSEITVEQSTSSVTLRVEFPNPDWLLWPGMYLRGRFEYDDGSKAFLIPQQAVIRSGQGASLYVVNAENKLELRQVKTLRAQGANWVLKEGLSPGDRVVVEGAQRVTAPVQPGSTVTPRPWSKLKSAESTPPADAAGAAPAQPAK